ncbi:MAG: aminotransferase class I/II-fold pyridoxal phosphate-dependent enzyme [Pirellulaceae bacterium]|nr:aminotransferase class I/II-fold pyridoxal phosphate-dependent enzyme [Pirellulaceae bacterium]
MVNKIFLSPPCMLGNERQLLLDAFDSNWIAPLGPHVDAFEREFAQRVHMPHAAALSSGTAALHLALLALGVRPDDEVITSSFTFAATANAITYVGARPVFIDSDRSSWNMDPNLLRDELVDCRQRNRLPAAILAVDILGQCCNYTAIEEICREFGVPLIEDAAEALGATLAGRPAGSFGLLSCFSFNGNKIITTSGGGMLVGRDAETVQHIRFLATQARDPAAHYEHSHIGYNYRMSNLLAAVGRGQLATLDQHVARRRANFEQYVKLLQGSPGIAFMPEIPGGRSTRWLTVVLVDPDLFGRDRESIRLELEAHQIESRPAWKPMHCQPIFRNCRSRGGQVSEEIFRLGLCLPSGSSLQTEDITRIVQVMTNNRVASSLIGNS